MTVMMGWKKAYCRIPCLHLYTNSLPMGQLRRQQKGKKCLICGFSFITASRSISMHSASMMYTIKL